MIHREPILSSLAAGSPPRQADEAGTNVPDNDNLLAVKKAPGRVRKPVHWPLSSVISASSSSASVDQDASDSQKQSAAAAKTQSAGLYLITVERTNVIN